MATFHSSLGKASEILMDSNLIGDSVLGVLVTEKVECKAPILDLVNIGWIFDQVIGWGNDLIGDERGYGDCIIVFKRERSVGTNVVDAEDDERYFVSCTSRSIVR